MYLRPRDAHSCQKPARQVRIALAMASGLAMGETRRSPAREEFTSSPSLAGTTSPASADAWEAYLQERGLVEWAQSNPHLGESLRQQLFPAP